MQGLWPVWQSQGFPFCPPPPRWLLWSLIYPCCSLSLPCRSAGATHQPWVHPSFQVGQKTDFESFCVYPLDSNVKICVALPRQNASASFWVSLCAGAEGWLPKSDHLNIYKLKLRIQQGSFCLPKDPKKPHFKVFECHETLSKES